ncbi:MAG TPA: phosphoadenylyl-sulfate reductase [Bryobacteraceae bacterium]|nr:phosphoadenylyl-sulfate reductase [Bryobacteraceae bacterium]
MSPVASARGVVDAAVAEFGSSLAVLTSFQREGVIILDLVMRASPRTSVITIDTGRLPEATNQIIRDVESRYGISVERLHPDQNEIDAMTEVHGADLFRDGVPQRMLCCNVRKVRPLSRRMKTVSAYFTGIRRAHNTSRGDVEVVDRSGSPVKISPLADWSSEDVLRYTAEHKLPEHSLYAAGYTSIGCDPCTRAVVVGEDERSGRWWWESDAAKECGLHFSADGKAERKVDVLLRELLERTKAA